MWECVKNQDVYDSYVNVRDFKRFFFFIKDKNKNPKSESNEECLITSSRFL